MYGSLSLRVSHVNLHAGFFSHNSDVDCCCCGGGIRRVGS